jgi:hypothetical protein
MKPITKLITGILTGLLVIGFIVVWDLVIKPSIESVEVVVVKPNIVIHKYDDIKQDQLIVAKRNREMLIEGYVKPEDLTTLVGREAAQTLVGNQIVSTRFVDFDNTEPNPKKGEAIRPIPNQWIYALPATLRRLDSIDVYLIASDKLKETSAYTQTSNDTQLVGLSPEQEKANEEKEKELVTEDNRFKAQRTALSENKSYTENNVLGESQEVLDVQGEREKWLEEKGLSEEQWRNLAAKGDIPVLVDVPVAYAKDGTGNEIQSNAEGEVKTNIDTEETRLSSTGAITNLELMLNEDNHRLLMKYINEGYQLYITYN